MAATKAARHRPGDRRWNAIDVAVGLVLILLASLGYATHVLSRIAPTVTAIEPQRLVQGSDPRVTLRGRQLSASLEVFIGRERAADVVARDGALNVELPELEPGRYDLVVYDLLHEIVRWRDAITIAPKTTPAEIAVRVITVPEVLPLLKAGDVDRSRAGPVNSPASLLRYGNIEKLTGRTQVSIGGPNNAWSFGPVERPLVVVSVDLGVTAVDSPDGWRWKGQLLKIGLPLLFETGGYALRGRIVNLVFPGAAAAPARRNAS